MKITNLKIIRLHSTQSNTMIDDIDIKSSLMTFSLNILQSISITLRVGYTAYDNFLYD